MAAELGLSSVEMVVVWAKPSTLKGDKMTPEEREKIQEEMKKKNSELAAAQAAERAKKISQAHAKNADDRAKAKAKAEKEAKAKAEKERKDFEALLKATEEKELAAAMKDSPVTNMAYIRKVLREKRSIPYSVARQLVGMILRNDSCLSGNNMQQSATEIKKTE